MISKSTVSYLSLLFGTIDRLRLECGLCDDPAQLAHLLGRTGENAQSGSTLPEETEREIRLLLTNQAPQTKVSAQPEFMIEYLFPRMQEMFQEQPDKRTMFRTIFRVCQPKGKTDFRQCSFQGAMVGCLMGRNMAGEWPEARLFDEVLKLGDSVDNDGIRARVVYTVNILKWAYIDVEERQKRQEGLPKLLEMLFDIANKAVDRQPVDFGVISVLVYKPLEKGQPPCGVGPFLLAKDKARYQALKQKIQGLAEPEKKIQQQWKGKLDEVIKEDRYTESDDADIKRIMGILA